MLLLSLARVEAKAEVDLSQQTWAALHMLHRLRGNHNSYLPGKAGDPVYRDYDMIRMVREREDAFGLQQGPLGSALGQRRYGDSRFDEGMMSVELQEYGELERVESLRKNKGEKREVAKFFEKGILPDPSDTPFGFPITLPPLGTMPTSFLPFQPTPSPYSSQQASPFPSPSPQQSSAVSWLDLVEELHSQGPKFFQVDPSSRHSNSLWESNPAEADYHGVVQLKDLKDYERLYLRSVDTFGRGKKLGSGCASYSRGSACWVHTEGISGCAFLAIQQHRDSRATHPNSRNPPDRYESHPNSLPPCLSIGVFTALAAAPRPGEAARSRGNRSSGAQLRRGN